MNEALPPSLQKPNVDEAEEKHTELREMLEDIMLQNAKIIEILDEWDDEDDHECKLVTQNVKVSGWAIFWESAFSLWGLLIVVIICAMLTQIFSGTPLLK